MRRLLLPLLILTFAVPAATGQTTGWSALPPLPDSPGVAAPFAGVSGGALLVAGGANFPEAPPWSGGKKVWHDTVLVLDTPTGSWKIAGKLPRPLGYGVSVTHDGAVICIGGSDADRQHAVFQSAQFHRHAQVAGGEPRQG